MADKGFSEDLQKQLLIALRKIIRTVDQHSRKLIKSYGLTIPQLIVLQEIMASEGSTVSKLAKAVTLSQPTVTDIVERLQSRGFLKRIPSGKDRRSNIITSTEKGIALLNQKPSLFPTSFLGEFDGLQEWERTQMLSVLQRMARMMSQMDITPIVLPGGLEQLPPDFITHPEDSSN